MLEQNGIVAVRFDLGGHGESDEEFFNVTISKEVEEGKAIIDFVKNLGFVDETKISLLRMSLGSVVAGETPNNIQALCMWSPAAVVTDEINIDKTIQGQSILQIKEQEYFDFNSLKLGPNFINDVADLKIYSNASRFKGDVKIIYGDKDLIVPPEYAFKYKEAYSQEIIIKIVEGADHSWGNIPHREALFKETLSFFIKI
ncbi:alpha/beta hydrolase [Bacillus sp. S2(2024)]|uniref:alpha/beta hydrolase n=1 Tax=Bacillus sp. S2(2024) TaxID=3162887 RepID=UPI003D21505A